MENIGVHGYCVSTLVKTGVMPLKDRDLVNLVNILLPNLLVVNLVNLQLPNLLVWWKGLL